MYLAILHASFHMFGSVCLFLPVCFRWNFTLPCLFFLQRFGLLRLYVSLPLVRGALMRPVLHLPDVRSCAFASQDSVPGIGNRAVCTLPDRGKRGWYISDRYEASLS